MPATMSILSVHGANSKASMKMLKPKLALTFLCLLHPVFAEFDISRVIPHIILKEGQNFWTDDNGKGPGFYTRDGEMGKGFYGFVYKAESPEGVQRAVKWVTPRTDQKESDFRNEISRMKSLDHPNIMKLLETYERKDNNIISFFLVMELAVGDAKNYAKIFQKLKTQNSHLELESGIRAMFSALAYVHESQLKQPMHGDFKRDQMLFMWNGSKVGTQTSWKLSDFDIGSFSDSYLSPERLWTRLTSCYAPVPSSSDDAWALGVTLFKIRTQKYPYGKPKNMSTLQEFQEDITTQIQQNMENWEKATTTSTSPPAQGHDADFERRLLTVVNGLLQAKPESRISMRDALKHLNPAVPKNVNGDIEDQDNIAAPNNQLLSLLSQWQTLHDDDKRLRVSIAREREETDEIRKECLKTFQEFDTNGDGILTEEDGPKTFQVMEYFIPAASASSEDVTERRVQISEWIAATTDISHWEESADGAPPAPLRAAHRKVGTLILNQIATFCNSAGVIWFDYRALFEKFFADPATRWLLWTVSKEEIDSIDPTAIFMSKLRVNVMPKVQDSDSEKDAKQLKDFVDNKLQFHHFPNCSGIKFDVVAGGHGSHSHTIVIAFENRTGLKRRLQCANGRKGHVNKSLGFLV